jgi:hypothetical protein
MHKPVMMLISPTASEIVSRSDRKIIDESTPTTGTPRNPMDAVMAGKIRMTATAAPVAKAGGDQTGKGKNGDKQ